MAYSDKKKFSKLFHGCSTIRQTMKKLCGEHLGTGLYREVFVLKQDPDYVLKIEYDPSTGMFANVTEWRNWVNNKEFKFLAPWLAPCESINQTGQVLIQRRVSWEGKSRKDYPKRIPWVITDTKLKNFGWIGDRFVCCDYSYLLEYNRNKMKRVTWRGSLKHTG